MEEDVYASLGAYNDSGGDGGWSSAETSVDQLQDLLLWEDGRNLSKQPNQQRWNASNSTGEPKPIDESPFDANNYWALLALVLVLGTAAGNILVCLAIAWERRLQNVTNYFLMSLAITDLMVAMLVMPLGILTLVKGYFPLGSEHCLTWICLDVLFCTASIMHLCTISVDRYLSLRYPMRFGRNKTRRRVTLKIVFVWLLSIAMSLPLSLMYSKNHASVLVNGTCQIPDPVYKLVGSIVCFYIPLGVMLLTYCLTVRLLARQRQNLGGGHQTAAATPGWASGATTSSPCMLQRQQTVRSHHSRNSSVISRNSSRHGRIIRLEQKATKVLGVVFFTFVILWSPFFVLNLLPTVCAECEERISHWVFDVVTWLGYASSMVNPIFYTIFNKVFRQAFKKVLLCRYSSTSAWRPSR
ncbi:GL23028 [Drosophila persimilis]|uniref:GL23028 n=1 Tax=Drosophila persimilis TaxID=7234 RepID=B4G465_DROPE|nr:GL23028 [Drosophila persimilis]